MAVPSSLTTENLPPEVRVFSDKWAAHCRAAGVHVCDGSEEEEQALVQLLVDKGSIVPLPKLENWCVCVCVCACAWCVCMCRG